MATYHVTYQFTCDPGDLPDEALAEYLELAEANNGTYTIWEMGSTGNPKLVEVKLVSES